MRERGEREKEMLLLPLPVLLPLLLLLLPLLPLLRRDSQAPV